MIFLYAFFAVLLINIEQEFGQFIATAILGTVSFCLILLTVVRQRNFFFPKKLTIALGLFFLWNLISAIFSQNVEMSIWAVLQLGSYIAIFLGVFNLVKAKPDLGQKFIISLILLTLFLNLKDLIPYVLSGAATRYTGLLNWHNQTAGLLLFLIFPLLGLLLSTKKSLTRVGFAAGLLICLLSLFWTGSRGAFLALGGGFISFFRKKLFIIIALLAVLGLFISRLLLGNISSSSDQNSNQFRLSVWRGTQSITSDFPIVGTGPGTFGTVYHHYQNEPWFWAKDAHNHFFQVAAETGIPGVLIFSSVFAVIILYFVKSHPRDLFTLSLVGALTASTAHALVDFDWSTSGIFIFFWIFLAVVVANLRIDEEAFKIFGKKQLWYLVPAFFIAISVLLFFAELSYTDQDYSSAIALNPLSSRYRFAAGQLEETLRLAPFNSQVYYLQGLEAIKDKNYSEASKLFTKAVSFSRYNHPENYLALAKVDLAMGDTAGAKKILNKAIYEAFPKNNAYYSFEYLAQPSGIKDLLDMLESLRNELNPPS